MAGDEMLNEWEVRVKHNESFDGGKAGSASRTTSD